MSEAAFRIRLGLAADRAALIDLRWDLNLAERAVAAPARQEDLDEGREAAALGIDAILERVERLGGAILIAERDGVIIGCVYWHREQASASFKPDRRAQAILGNLSVTPSARSLGVGTALMRAVEDQVKAAGLSRLELNVVAQNDRARALYHAQGYAPVEIRMSKRL